MKEKYFFYKIDTYVLNYDYYYVNFKIIHMYITWMLLSTVETEEEFKNIFI